MDNETKSSIATQLLNTLPTSKQDDSFYTLIVNGDNQGFDSETRYIPIDMVSNVSVSASSDITSFPLINGDVISDHKYDNPRTVEISGKFSLNGKLANQDNAPFSIPGDKSSRLKNIEEYFFAVRKYGKFISLVSSLNGNTRFTTIDNLAISNLRFVRSFNILEFSISLKEIYCYENDNELDILESVSDPDMPSLTGFKTLDFAKDVLTYDSIDEMTVTCLADNNLIAANFADTLAELILPSIQTVAITSLTTALVYITIKVLVKLGLAVLSRFTMYGVSTASLSAVLASNPVGWVLFGAAAITACIVAIVKAVKRNSYIAEFKHYNNEEANREECERFGELVSKVRDSFKLLAKNNNLKFYRFTSNSACKQTAYLTIDNNIYQFNVERISNGWSLQVINNSDDDSTIATKNTTKLIGSKNLLGLTTNDAIFHTSNKTYIYIFNKALAYEDYSTEELNTILTDQWKTGSLGFMGYSKEEMKSENVPTDLVYKFLTDGIYQDLTQFIFVVTNVKLTELEEALKKTTINCFKKDS